MDRRGVWALWLVLRFQKTPTPEKEGMFRPADHRLPLLESVADVALHERVDSLRRQKQPGLDRPCPFPDTVWMMEGNFRAF